MFQVIKEVILDRRDYNIIICNVESVQEAKKEIIYDIFYSAINDELRGDTSDFCFLDKLEELDYTQSDIIAEDITWEDFLQTFQEANELGWQEKRNRYRIIKIDGHVDYRLDKSDKKHFEEYLKELRAKNSYVKEQELKIKKSQMEYLLKEIEALEE